MPRVTDEPKRLNWFQRHLNWTVILAVIAGYAIAFGTGFTLESMYPGAPDEAFLGIVFIPLAVILPVAGWALRQKNRRLWWLLILFVPFGWIVFLCLENRRHLGKTVTMRQGKDATIIAIGVMLSAALEAADNLKRQGIDCRVLNMPTLKPIDEAAIIEAASETGAIVTAEDHLEHGGLGSIVSQVVARHHPMPMEFVAIKDTYAKSGRATELLQRYGLTAKDIENAVSRVIKKKL